MLRCAMHMHTVYVQYYVIFCYILLYYVILYIYLIIFAYAVDIHRYFAQGLWMDFARRRGAVPLMEGGTQGMSSSSWDHRSRLVDIVESNMESWRLNGNSALHTLHN